MTVVRQRNDSCVPEEAPGTTQTVEGVYSLWETRRLLARPRRLVEIVPQIVDRYHLRRPVSARPELRALVRQLDRDGVAVLESVVPAAFVEKARRDIDLFVDRISELEGTTRIKPASTGGTREYPVHEHQRDLRIYRSHDPLVFSTSYARFLLLPEVTEAVSGYLGRSWLYQAMITTRTEPSPVTRRGFAQWHHDARGRKLNVFLLLSDVPPDGSATVVLKGSHRMLYSRSRRERNFFTDPEVEALQQRHGWEPGVCAARAGSLVFFDSQALHLGRRSLHLRDAFQVNCMTARSHLWPQQISQEIFRSLKPREREQLLRRARLRVCS